MKDRKERLTVTVDRALVDAANKAVAAGRAASLSGWVNQALVERAAKERRLVALADAIASYESKFGVITDAELEARVRADRRSAIVIRGSRQAARNTRRRAA